MGGDAQHRCGHCGTKGQPGDGCVMGCDSPAVFEARERAARCPQCLWLIGHLPTCSLRPKTEREQEWNAGLDAAEAAVRASLTSGLLTAAQVTRAVESIARLKR